MCWNRCKHSRNMHRVTRFPWTFSKLDTRKPSKKLEALLKDPGSQELKFMGDVTELGEGFTGVSWNRYNFRVRKAFIESNTLRIWNTDSKRSVLNLQPFGIWPINLSLVVPPLSEFEKTLERGLIPLVNSKLSSSRFRSLIARIQPIKLPKREFHRLEKPLGNKKVSLSRNLALLVATWNSF